MLYAQQSVLLTIFVLDSGAIWHVSVCWLAVYFMAQGVSLLCDKNIQKGKLTIFFYVHGESNTRMLVVEKV